MYHLWVSITAQVFIWQLLFACLYLDNFAGILDYIAYNLACQLAYWLLNKCTCHIEKKLAKYKFFLVCIGQNKENVTWVLYQTKKL
jgi:hypothetical protein